MRHLIHSFSYIFHPLFIALYATGYYLYTIKDFLEIEYKSILFTQITITTFLIPLGIYFILRYLNRIESIMMASVKERKIPLAINCILLLILIKNNLQASYTPELFVFFVACLISSIIALFFSIIHFKVSLHMIGISILAAFIILLQEKEWFDIMIQSILITSVGLVATSRLIMKAHTSIELITGLVVGIIPIGILFNYWL